MPQHAAPDSQLEDEPPRASHGHHLRLPTVAPNGMPWWQYCQGRPVSIDPASGFLIGPWGECLAWAKVFEIRNLGWQQDPRYANQGPCARVIEAALAECP